MIRDFSTTFDGKQSIRFRPIQVAEAGFLWRFTGLIATIAMFVGISGTLVFGWLIKTGLNDIGNMGVSRLDLMKTQKELLVERDALLLTDNIEQMAAKIGLFPPTKRQIRRP